MPDDRRQQADARLGAALRDAGFEDSRPAYRQRLRELRNAHPALFERALQHYEAEVVPALLDGPDPLATWIEYGRLLADQSAPGRLVAIDASGRALPHVDRELTGCLVLHMPDETGVAPLPLAVPIDASPAQRATLDLLVYGRVQIGA